MDIESTTRRAFLRLAAAATAAAPLGAAAPSNPTVPYGAVYFRKSNPQSADWERDYAQAAADGLNTFRHWFMWSAIEVAPGKYDWADYDRQLDLAAERGLGTIIGEFLGAAPDWAFRRYPHAQVRYADGSVAGSRYIRASAVGGWPGLCLDNDDVHAVVERYLRALATRYRDHPAMAGYDVWNELNQNGDAGGCWCSASAGKFRVWLKDKYGDLQNLGKAWYRYGYETWEDVQIPREIGPYPDNLDWSQFRIDNAMRLFEWRVGILREVDGKNPITAHAISKAVLDRVGEKTYPVFQAAKLVDVYGYTGGGSHDEATRLRWQHWCDMDLTRSAAKGKPFWAGEMAAGNQWRWRAGHELNQGRVSTGEDIRLYSLMHLAGGARGIFSPRWRPLQDGPFAGMFAFYAMDGSPTPRSEAASRMARWANAPEQASAMAARPVQGDLGILVVPESQIHDYYSEGSTANYHAAITGAFQGFLFNNLQVDFVPADDIGPAYDVLYLPYPVMLTEKTARAIGKWVAAGGTLISEGLPAYFGDHGRAGATQPRYGLEEVFGVRQGRVQLTPDLLKSFSFNMHDGYSVRGGVFLQTYEPTTARAIAKMDSGEIVGVENAHGKGRARLIGTFPGIGYSRSDDHEATGRFFRESFAWTGKTPHVESSDSRIIARLQTGDSGDRFLWCVNASRQPIETRLTVSGRWGQIDGVEAVWGEVARVEKGEVIAAVPARDAVVLRLD